MWYREIGSILKNERNYVIMKNHFVLTKLYNMFATTVEISTYQHGLNNVLLKLNMLLNWIAQEKVW